jgi:hypothetical protein
VPHHLDQKSARSGSVGLESAWVNAQSMILEVVLQPSVSNAKSSASSTDTSEELRQMSFWILCRRAQAGRGGVVFVRVSRVMTAVNGILLYSLSISR